MALHENVANLLNDNRRTHEEITEEIREQNDELEKGKKEIEDFKKKMNKTQPVNIHCSHK